MQEEINIRRQDLQTILTGHLAELEQFLLKPSEIFNQATTTFILEQTSIALLANPKNHCAMTLAGFAKLFAKPAGSNTPDLAAALRYFEQAAELGNPHAIACAADCYANAKGTEQNLIKAAQYYRKALKMLGNHAKTKADFDLMVRRFQCPPEAWYHYNIANNTIDRLWAPNTWKNLCFLYFDQDPTLTRELKLQYKKLIWANREIDVFSRSSELYTVEGLLVCGMFACWEAEACHIDDNETICMKLQFAVQCVEHLEKLEEFAVNQLILTDTIELVQARWMLATLDLDEPQNVFDIVEKLVSIKTLGESHYLLADLLMRLNTENIFLNHKDKYRLIIGLLSRVDEETKLRAPAFALLLKNAIASLQSIQTAADFSTPDDTVYLSFKQVVQAVPGLPDHSKLLYSPRLEYELTQSEKAQKHITDTFGKCPIVTFEQLIYKSYTDCYEQLNLNYLHERLLKQLQSRILPKKPAVEELVIQSGNAGLGRKRQIAFTNIRVAIDMRLRDLVLKAIELALVEFNTAVNGTGFYALAFKQHYKAAKQLQEKCIEQSDFKEILKMIVTFLTRGPGGLDKGWFKLALLQQLTQALNLGNIERLDNEPNAFCKDLCAILLEQCQPRDLQQHNNNLKAAEISKK